MKSNAARKMKQVPEGYLIIGIDVHKKKHAAVVMTQDFTIYGKFKFSNSKEGFEMALERARMRMVKTGCRGVIFARITPCMQNGKAAITKNLVNGTAFGSTEFHVIRPGPKLKAEWLHVLVRHKAFRDDAAARFKGTAGQQRVPQSFLERKLIPIPPLTEQQRILAYLLSLGNKVKELERLQKETSAELDALIPSILDRAFKGKS